MPIFRLNMTFLDSRGGQTNKQIEGDFADYTTAETEAAIVITNWQAASGAAIIEWTLGQVNTVASSPTAGSRVTDRLSATLRLDTPGKLVNFRLPAPALPFSVATVSTTTPHGLPLLIGSKQLTDGSSATARTFRLAPVLTSPFAVS